MFMQRRGSSSRARLREDPAVNLSGSVQVIGNTDEKQKILAKLFPKAVMTALSPEARTALPAVQQANGVISILSFPFRVGRESRVMVINNTVHRVERPTLHGSAPNNDIYLMDAGQMLQISREHFRIDQTADGYLLTDRGSKCGLAVNGKRIGAETGIMSVTLNDGDVIAIGNRTTPYLYTFVAGFENVRQ
jgi:pSer/pThr/pTyr-binding forkhead associated (FHA) protein